MTLGLERIGRLLDELDHPERRLHGALVGGTNGKGSVVALVSAVLLVPAAILPVAVLGALVVGLAYAMKDAGDDC